MEKQRFAFIDYGKAIAIIAVLFEHLGVGVSSTLGVVSFTPCIFPLFFVVFGYTLNLKDKSLKGFTKNMFKKLMIPFWIFMLLDIPLDIARAYLYKYGTYKLVFPILVNTIYGSAAKIPNVLRLFGLGNTITNYMSHKTQGYALWLDTILPTNCHLWFLPAMFTGSILFFVIIKRFRNKNFALLVFSLLLLFVAGLESLDCMPQLPYGLGRGCLAAAFMIFGYKLKELSLFEQSSIVTKTLIFFVSLAITIIFIKFFDVDKGLCTRSIYGPYGIWSVFWAFIGGISTIVMILMFCRLLEQVGIGVIGRVMSAIGQNTMPIFLWQFLGFFVLDFLYLKISGESAAPDKYWMVILPVSATWYKFIEIAVFIATMLFIEHFRKRKRS